MQHYIQFVRIINFQIQNKFKNQIQIQIKKTTVYACFDNDDYAIYDRVLTLTEADAYNVSEYSYSMFKFTY